MTLLGTTRTSSRAVALFLAVVVALLAAYFYKQLVYKLDSPVVHTAQGQLTGYEARSRSGKQYYSYLGIPYAKAPVGQLRFEPPEPPESWTGIRDATSYGSKCLQFDIMLRTTGGDEDCLFVNVFTPKWKTQRAGAGSAVMVYIYGGLFISGASNMYLPSYMMDEDDLLLVTFNYRVGALGFLNTGDGVVRGNMGLKDQTMALRWVQDNIAAFGGDPKRVTLFGESAGAASVHYHMLSPMSKGLFQRGISQSGTALNHWALYDQPREQAQRFSQGHGCDQADSQAMVECLRKVDAYTLVDSHREVMRPLRDWITIFNPTIESITDEHAFLTEQSIDLLRKGKLSNDVPWIAGVNSHEGLMASAAIFRNESMIKRIETEFDHVASNLFEVYPPNSSEIRALRQFYKLGVDPREGPSPTLPDLDSQKFRGYTDIFSDRMFNAPLHLAATIQSNAPGLHAPIYLYYYTYKGDVSIAEFMLAARGQFPVMLEFAFAYVTNWVKRNVLGMKLRQFDGPCHADEVGMFFPMLWGAPVKTGHPDYEFSRDIVKLWADFAKHDDAGQNQKLQFRGVGWEPVYRRRSTSPGLQYLQLDSTPHMIHEPFTDRVRFWNKLGIDIQ